MYDVKRWWIALSLTEPDAALLNHPQSPSIKYATSQLSPTRLLAKHDR